MQSVKPKGQSKTDSHWVDSAVDSQSEAAVSVNVMIQTDFLCSI